MDDKSVATNSTSENKLTKFYNDKCFNEDDSSIEQPIWEEDSLPPSYDSIFGHFKDRQESSESALGFFKRAIEIFAGTVGCTASLILLLALPVAMVIVGAEYKNECPVEPFIPVYLIVGGTFGMLKTVVVLCQRAIRIEVSEEDVEEQQSMAAQFFDGVLNLFLFIWFIAGNIWVYSKYKPNFAPPKHDPLNFCNPTLYLFAFWVITSSYILMGIIFFCICCLGLCASCTAFVVTNTAK